MKTITVTINEDGSTTVATSGFAGASCKAATAELEAALGATTSDTPTHEMRQQTTATKPNVKAGR